MKEWIGLIISSFRTWIGSLRENKRADDIELIWGQRHFYQRWKLKLCCSHLQFSVLFSCLINCIRWISSEENLSRKICRNSGRMDLQEWRKLMIKHSKATWIGTSISKMNFKKSWTNLPKGIKGLITEDIQLLVQKGFN